MNNESAYLATVNDALKTEYLVQVYAPGVGHGAFTSRQLLLALTAVERRLETGVKPDSSAFSGAEGFDPAFVPPAWR